MLETSTLNSFKKNLKRSCQIVQFHSSSKFSGSEPQRIALRSSPSTPFNYYRQANCEEFLTKLPLQHFNLLALLGVPKIDLKSIHPLIGRKADSVHLCLNLPGICGLA